MCRGDRWQQNTALSILRCRAFQFVREYSTSGMLGSQGPVELNKQSSPRATYKPDNPDTSSFNEGSFRGPSYININVNAMRGNHMAAGLFLAKPLLPASYI